MIRCLTLSVLVVLATIIQTASAKAEVDCSLLDPRASVSTAREGKIDASVKTLFKIAKAGGSVEGKIKNEIQNLQKGATVTEKGQIELRTLYLFCGMVANAKDITTDRKIALFNLMMKSQGKTASEAKKGTPKSGSPPSKASAVARSNGAKANQQQNATQPNQQTNINVTSNSQSGGITAQNVTINNYSYLKDDHDNKSKEIVEKRLLIESKAVTLEEKKFISDLYDKRSKLSDQWRTLYDKYAELNQARGYTFSYDFELQTLRIKMDEITKQIVSVDDSLSELEKKNRSEYEHIRPPLPPGRLRPIQVN